MSTGFPTLLQKPRVLRHILPLAVGLLLAVAVGGVLYGQAPGHALDQTAEQTLAQSPDQASGVRRNTLTFGLASDRAGSVSRFSDFTGSRLSLASWGSGVAIAPPGRDDVRLAGLPALSAVGQGPSSVADFHVGGNLDAADQPQFSGVPGSSTGGTTAPSHSAILTLTTGYFEDSAMVTGEHPRFLSAHGRRGRWAFYGEFAKGSVSSKRVLPGNAGESHVSSPVRAQLLDSAGTSATQQQSRTLSLANSEMPTGLTADKVYLEAVYDFRPTVSGKLSYQRSVVDVLDQQKHLKLEGVVKTGPDTEIKAGYKNQTLPEVSQDTSNNKDTQVWTEFILKF